jgi:hypothetical protein
MSRVDAATNSGAPSIVPSIPSVENHRATGAEIVEVVEVDQVRPRRLVQEGRSFRLSTASC